MPKSVQSSMYILLAKRMSLFAICDSVQGSKSDKISSSHADNLALD